MTICHRSCLKTRKRRIRLCWRLPAYHHGKLYIFIRLHKCDYPYMISRTYTVVRLQLDPKQKIFSVHIYGECDQPPHLGNQPFTNRTKKHRCIFLYSGECDQPPSLGKPEIRYFIICGPCANGCLLRLDTIPVPLTLVSISVTFRIEWRGKGSKKNFRQ